MYGRRACLFQGNTQDAAIEVGHIYFGLGERVRQLDAHMLNQIISVSLVLVVWNLPHNEDQILQHNPHASWTAPYTLKIMHLLLHPDRVSCRCGVQHITVPL